MKGKQTKFLSKLFRTVLLPSAMLAVATQAQAADYGYYGYSAYRAQLTKLTIHTLGQGDLGYMAPAFSDNEDEIWPSRGSLAYLSNLMLLTDSQEQLLGILTGSKLAVSSQQAKDSFHLVGDIAYAKTKYKNWMRLEQNGPSLVAGGYYAKDGHLLGLFVQGGSYKYDVTQPDISSNQDHGKSKQLGVGVVGRWAPNDFWLEGSAQLAINQFSSDMVTYYTGDSSSQQPAYAAHLGVGWHHAWSSCLSTDLYGSYLFARVDKSAFKGQYDDLVYFDAISSQRTRVGGRVFYELGQPESGVRQQLYAGIAYQHEYKLKLPTIFLDYTSPVLAPNRCLVEVGYNMLGKFMRVKLGVTSSFGKMSHHLFSLSVGCHLDRL